MTTRTSFVLCVVACAGAVLAGVSRLARAGDIAHDLSSLGELAPFVRLATSGAAEADNAGYTEDTQTRFRAVPLAGLGDTLAVLGGRAHTPRTVYLRVAADSTLQIPLVVDGDGGDVELALRVPLTDPASRQSFVMRIGLDDATPHAVRERVAGGSRCDTTRGPLVLSAAASQPLSLGGGPHTLHVALRPGGPSEAFVALMVPIPAPPADPAAE